MEQIRKYFDQVYNETYDKTLAYILTKCGRNDVVEDILQETYAELFQILEDKGVAYILAPEAFVMQLQRVRYIAIIVIRNGGVRAAMWKPLGQSTSEKKSM